ncbi:MAG: helical backbone metal receptor [Melioribacteraceae bacterium]|nr:helical backbone metal receptor [Melioribacteraceae bacterium]
MKINHIFLAILFFTTSLTAQKFDVVDDLERKIKFDSSPSRVISLAPNITEMIYLLEVDSTLVGNTKYCYYPEEAKSVTKVGDMINFNFEKIVELSPDLIFITVEGNQKTAYDKLIDLGLKVFVSNPRDYTGIKKTFNDLGKIFDKEERTNNLTNEWDSTYNYILDQSKNLKTKDVMILVELNPIMVAGRNTFINSYLEICNMKNFAEDLKMNYPVFSREVVIERDPQIICLSIFRLPKTLRTLRGMYPEWKALSAVKKRKCIFC